MVGSWENVFEYRLFYFQDIVIEFGKLCVPIALEECQTGWGDGLLVFSIEVVRLLLLSRNEITEVEK